MKFVLNERVPVQEDDRNEFKEITSRDPSRTITDTCEKYIVGFLNGKGGSIFWGIRDEGVVIGVSLDSAQRDDVRKGIAGKVHGVQPRIDPSRCELIFHEIEGAPDNTHLTIVEVSVSAISSPGPYYTSSGDAYIRLNGVLHSLSGTALTDWLRNRLQRAHIRDAKPNDPTIVGIAERVRRVFHEHGLESAHLPRFLQNLKAPFTITLRDLQSTDDLLGWLDESKIDWISHTFLVRREWLDGEDDRIHSEFYFDKHPQEFWSTISQHVDTLIWENLPATPEAYFLQWREKRPWSESGVPRIFVVVAVPIARMSDERIVYKYITDREPYPWEYGRTQIQLRAWARLLFHHKGATCFGRAISQEVGNDLENNSVFLRGLIEKHVKRSRDDWNPEDYGLSDRESRVAKDSETFPQVLDFLRQHNLPCDETKQAPG